MRKKNPVSIIIICSFLLLVGWFSIGSFPLITKPLSDFFQNKISIKQLNHDITEKLSSDELYHKEELINLNGLYGRLTKRRIYNDILRMNNGMISWIRKSYGIKYVTNDLIEAYSDFDRFAKENGAHFIFVPFPDKVDMQKELLPLGYDSSTTEEVRQFIEELQNAKIDAIDAYHLLNETSADVEINYYRTDHHWKPTAAYKTFQLIIEHLKTLYPAESFDDSKLSLENWEIHQIPEIFLGALGRRVGKYYSGIDTLEWITPNYPTELSFYHTEPTTYLHGDYNDVFIIPENMEPNDDVLQSNQYYIYIGKDYPLSEIRNPNAMSDKKLLLVKDSYSIPLLTFFSIVFREIDVIDPRYYHTMSLKEYINRTHPDFVIMAVSGSVIPNEEYYTFSKDDDELLSGERISLRKESVSTASNDNLNLALPFYDNFKNGTYYTLSIPSIEIINGSPDGFSVVLYDSKKQEIIDETVFDIDYCRKYNDCEWTFKTSYSGSKNLRLMIYPNIKEETGNADLRFVNAELFERIVSY